MHKIAILLINVYGILYTVPQRTLHGPYSYTYSILNVTI